MFQSTPLCEGRLTTDDAEKLDHYRFNPRPCVRGDAGAGEVEFANGVSIHAPV